MALRLEQETSIVWDEEDKIARIYSASPVSIRKLDKLCRECPETYKRVWTDEKNGAAKYEVYKGFIRFGKPRIVTDEQREAAKERFARIRSERQDNKGENEDENLDDD